jgi:hypothetical protein
VSGRTALDVDGAYRAATGIRTLGEDATDTVTTTLPPTAAVQAACGDDEAGTQFAQGFLDIGGTMPDDAASLRTGCTGLGDVTSLAARTLHQADLDNGRLLHDYNALQQFVAGLGFGPDGAPLPAPPP